MYVFFHGEVANIHSYEFVNFGSNPALGNRSADYSAVHILGWLINGYLGKSKRVSVVTQMAHWGHMLKPFPWCLQQSTYNDQPGGIS